MSLREGKKQVLIPETSTARWALLQQPKTKLLQDGDPAVQQESNRQSISAPAQAFSAGHLDVPTIRDAGAPPGLKLHLSWPLPHEIPKNLRDNSGAGHLALCPHPHTLPPLSRGSTKPATQSKNLSPEYP